MQRKYIPLISFGAMAFYFGYAAIQISNAEKAILQNEIATNPQAAAARAQSGTGNQPSGEPAYKILIRCLSDLDDMLDTVRDAKSFNAVKPKILDRMRQHVALAASHPNPGMAQLSRAAAKEMEKAMNRHTESMTRASQVAPGVTEFFSKEVGAILNQKK